MQDWQQDVEWECEKEFVKALALMKVNTCAEWLFYKECVHVIRSGVDRGVFVFRDL